LVVEAHTTRSDRASPSLNGAPEFARYFDTAGGQIYSVLHATRSVRRGAVLLCGPFGAERERAYLSLVKWARTLAAQGFDTLRFDYRGVGESSGTFEDSSLSEWSQDAELCAARLCDSAPDVPLILHGVRLGALIAAELFAAGLGDALLLWQPPPSGGELLRETLRHNLIAQRFNDPGAPGKTREQQIAALEAGELVNVDGYRWSARLWNDAQRHSLTAPSAGERRPWKALQVRGSAPSSLEDRAPAHVEHVDAERFWGTSSMLLVPRVEAFFQSSLCWLDECEATRARAS
jgi:pimeloyl-ACP methyl ester carboxylesterase